MTFTYINFNNFKGEELDKDFRNFCIKQGMTDNDKFNVLPVQSITGHQAFIVSVENA